MNSSKTFIKTYNPVNHVTIEKKGIEISFILLSFLWILTFFKPEWLIPGFPLRQLPTIVLLLLFIVWLFSAQKSLGNPQTKLFIAFVILVVISAGLARNTGFSRLMAKTMFLTLLWYLVTISYADEFRKIEKLITIFLLGSLLMAVLGVKGSGRVWIPSLRDENDFALFLNIVFPFAFFLVLEASEKRKRIVYLGVSLLFLAGIIISNSRGGFVGLVAVLSYCWYKAPKKIVSTIILIILIIGMLLMAPQSFWNEMQTITQGREESTGAARWFFWTMAVHEFLDNPIIGVGPLNYGIWLPDYIAKIDKFSIAYSNLTQYSSMRPENLWGEVCHSIYFTLLSELGIIGTLIFAGMLLTFEKQNRYIKKIELNKINLLKNTTLPEDEKNNISSQIKRLYFLSLAANGGMIGYLVSGLFLSVLYFNWFWFLITVGVLLNNEANRILKVVESKNEQT